MFTTLSWAGPPTVNALAHVADVVAADGVEHSGHEDKLELPARPSLKRPAESPSPSPTSPPAGPDDLMGGGPPLRCRPILPTTSRSPESHKPPPTGSPWESPPNAVVMPVSRLSGAPNLLAAACRFMFLTGMSDSDRASYMAVGPSDSDRGEQRGGRVPEVASQVAYQSPVSPVIPGPIRDHIKIHFARAVPGSKAGGQVVDCHTVSESPSSLLVPAV